MATTNQSRVVRELPPLWLNSQFGLAFGPITGFNFNGKQLRLVLTNETTLDRTVLTTPTLSSSDTVATFLEDSAWTIANLTEGWYEVHFWVDDEHFAAVRFEAVEPTGGNYSP